MLRLIGRARANRSADRVNLENDEMVLRLLPDISS
jgi:hypothetical protein